jgi:hypothetical protein
MRTLVRLKDWLFSSLAIIWIPLLLVILAGLLWMTFGACTTDRCIASQQFMEQLIREMNSGK